MNFLIEHFIYIFLRMQTIVLKSGGFWSQNQKGSYSKWQQILQMVSGVYTTQCWGRKTPQGCGGVTGRKGFLSICSTLKFEQLFLTVMAFDHIVTIWQSLYSLWSWTLSQIKMPLAYILSCTDPFSNEIEIPVFVVVICGGSSPSSLCCIVPNFLQWLSNKKKVKKSFFRLNASHYCGESLFFFFFFFFFWFFIFFFFLNLGW